jgi:ribosomal protein L11 methyltransferase
VSWQGLRIKPSAAPDEIIQALFNAGAIAVQEEGGDIVTHFPPEADISAITRDVTAADPDAVVSLSVTPDISVESLHGTVQVQRLGKITIAPPWESFAIDEPGLVVIHPAMGFGTGEHPTTRGVIRLMQKIIAKGDTVADLGAGSAILAIAAAKLGASRVYAIENDDQAIGNAEENVAGNRVGEVVSVIEGDAAVILPLVGPCSIVLANIISSVLMEIMPVIHDGVVTGGHAILSGILKSERELIVERASSVGFAIVEEDGEGEWWSVLLKRL